MAAGWLLALALVRGSLALKGGHWLSKDVHICMATDEPNPQGAAAVIRSALKNTKYPSRLKFHVVCPAEVCDAIKAAIPEANGCLDLRQPPAELEERLAGTLRLARSTKKRTLNSPFNVIPSYIPTIFADLHASKLIYLDDDTLVVSDITELAAIDMGKYAVAAVEDCQAQFNETISFDRVRTALAQRSGQKPDYSKVGPKTCIMNRGVFVVNVPQWKNLHVTEEMDWWMVQHMLNPKLWHRGVSQPPWLLAVGAIGYKRLPEAWNVRGCGWSTGGQVLWDQSAELRAKDVNTLNAVRKLGTDLSHVKVTASTLDARIIHYSGNNKPWSKTPCGVSLCSVRRGRYKLQNARCPAMPVQGGWHMIVECQDIWRSEMHEARPARS